MKYRVKENLGRQHFNSAKVFSEACAEIEESESALDWPQPNWEKAKSLSVATVMLSVAALEASNNELFLEAIDRNRNSLSSLTDDQLNTLSVLWPETKLNSTLSKYQLVLVVCGVEKMDQGSELYQSVQALIKLRNALIHFKPEWHDQLKEHRSLENRLKNRFEPSKLTAKAKGSMRWFPGKCLGAGAALWCVDTTKAFSNSFCDKLSIRARLVA